MTNPRLIFYTILFCLVMWIATDAVYLASSLESGAVIEFRGSTYECNMVTSEGESQ